MSLSYSLFEVSLKLSVSANGKKKLFLEIMTYIHKFANLKILITFSYH